MRTPAAAAAASRCPACRARVERPAVLVVSWAQSSAKLAPLAVDAVLAIIDTATDTNVDLRNIRVVKCVGGTTDDTELIPGARARAAALVVGWGRRQSGRERALCAQFG